MERRREGVIAMCRLLDGIAYWLPLLRLMILLHFISYYPLPCTYIYLALHFSTSSPSIIFASHCPALLFCSILLYSTLFSFSFLFCVPLLQGKCFRLYTERSFTDELQAQTYPEILRSRYFPLYFTILYCTILHWTILYYTVLSYNVLNCILYSMFPLSVHVSLSVWLCVCVCVNICVSVYGCTSMPLPMSFIYSISSHYITLHYIVLYFFSLEWRRWY